MQLEDWANVLTVISGIVLALAAVFAFIVQRARYLRETNVVLHVEKFDVPNWEWADHYETGNEIDISPTVVFRNDSDISVVMKCLDGSIRTLQSVSAQRALIYTSFESDVFVGPGESAPLETSFNSWRFEHGSSETFLITDFIVTYKTQLDLLMLLLKPCGLGRRRFRRRITSSFRAFYSSDAKRRNGAPKLELREFDWRIERRREKWNDQSFKQNMSEWWQARKAIFDRYEDV